MTKVEGVVVLVDIYVSTFFTRSIVVDAYSFFTNLHHSVGDNLFCPDVVWPKSPEIVVKFNVQFNSLESCAAMSCGAGRRCVVRGGRAKCVCAAACRRAGPVCGSDGKTYRSLCRLRRRACRRPAKHLSLDYPGPCRGKSYYTSLLRPPRSSGLRTGFSWCCNF